MTTENKLDELKAKAADAKDRSRGCDGRRKSTHCVAPPIAAAGRAAPRRRRSPSARQRLRKPARASARAVRAKSRAP